MAQAPTQVAAAVARFSGIARTRNQKRNVSFQIGTFFFETCV